MDKLYEKIEFHNNTAPALNEANLNAISKAIDDIDDRVIEGYASAMEAGTYTAQCQAYSTSAQSSATSASTSAASASSSASAASESAQLAASTVSDLSEQFQECIDLLDEIIGG